MSTVEASPGDPAARLAPAPPAQPARPRAGGRRVRAARRASSRPGGRGRAARWCCTCPSSSTSRCATATRCCSPPASRPPTPSGRSTRRRWRRCARRSTASSRATSRTRRWSSTAGGTSPAPTPASRCSPSMVAPHLLEPPANALRVTLHPEGMAPHIRNLPEWRAHLLDRLRREVAVTGDERLRRAAGRAGRLPRRRGDAARARARHRGAAAARRRRHRAGVLQHDLDVRHGRRHHARRAGDRGVLPRRRADRRLRAQRDEAVELRARRARRATRSAPRSAPSPAGAARAPAVDLRPELEVRTSSGDSGRLVATHMPPGPRSTVRAVIGEPLRRCSVHSISTATRGDSPAFVLTTAPWLARGIGGQAHREQDRRDGQHRDRPQHGVQAPRVGDHAERGRGHAAERRSPARA